MVNEVYFSPGEDCKKAIISALDLAKRDVKICVFTISDNNISRAIERAFKRGVTVTIITDNDKTNDKGSDIYTLFRTGIEVRVDGTSNHMHHKFAIFDDEKLITGSFNWTRSASKYNQENIIVTTEKVLVDKHVVYYRSLWQQMNRFW